MVPPAFRISGLPPLNLRAGGRSLSSVIDSSPSFGTHHRPSFSIASADADPSSAALNHGFGSAGPAGNSSQAVAAVKRLYRDKCRARA